MGLFAFWKKKREDEDKKAPEEIQRTSFDDFESQLGDIDILSGIEEGKRNPAKSVKPLLKSGVKSAAFQFGSTVRNEVERAMPEVSGSVKDIISAKDDLVGMVGDVKSSIRDTVKTSKRVGAAALTQLDGILPESLQKKLQKWSAQEKQENRGQSATDQRKKQTEDLLANIFQAQDQSHREEQKQAFVDKTLQRNIDKRYHQENTVITDQIRKEAVFQSRFITNLLTPYLKKTLELKYTHLLTAQDTFGLLTTMSGMLETKLEEIKNNTGLPDIQKQHWIESIKKESREGISKSVTETVKGQLGRMTKNIRTRVFDNFQQTLGMLREIGNMYASTTEELGGLDSLGGEGGDEFLAQFQTDESGGYGKKASFLTNWLSKGLGYLAGTRGFRKFEKKIKPKMTAFNDRFKYSDQNIMQFGREAQQKQYKSMYNDDKDLGFFQRFLFKNILSNLGLTAQKGLAGMLDSPDASKVRNQSTVNVASGSGKTQPTHFDIATKTSIVEIIPGYLSRILQQVTTLVTGKPADTMVYNFETRSFTDSMSYVKSIRSQFVQKPGELKKDVDTAISTLQKGILDKASDTEKSSIELASKSVDKDLQIYAKNCIKERMFPSASWLIAWLKEADKPVDKQHFTYKDATKGVKNPKALMEYLNTYMVINNHLSDLGTAFTNTLKGGIRLDDSQPMLRVIHDLLASGHGDLVRQMGFLDDKRSTGDKFYVNENVLDDINWSDVNPLAESEKGKGKRKRRRKGKGQAGNTGQSNINPLVNTGSEANPLTLSIDTDSILSVEDTMLHDKIDVITSALQECCANQDKDKEIKIDNSEEIALATQSLSVLSQIQELTSTIADKMDHITFGVLNYMNPDGTSDFHGKLWNLLHKKRSLAGVKTSLKNAGGAIKGAGKYVGGKLWGATKTVGRALALPFKVGWKGVQSAASFTEGFGKGLFGIGSKYFDVYLKDKLNGDPILSKDQQKQGVLLKTKDGTKKLERTIDIDNAVVDQEGNIIIKLEDIPNLRRADGKPLKGGKSERAGRFLGKLQQKLITVPFKAAWTVGVQLPARALAATGRFLNKDIGVLTYTFTDVYRVDKFSTGKPLITAQQQKEKKVKLKRIGKENKVTLEEIKSSHLIDTIVVDENNDEVITEEDLKIGLCDAKGKPIKSLLGKYGSKLWGATKFVGGGLLSAAGTVISAPFKLLGGVLKGLKNFGVGMVSGLFKARFFDIYDSRNAEAGKPLLTAKDQRDGVVAFATGKAIKNSENIDQPVINVSTGEVVIKQEDIPFLVTSRGKKIKPNRTIMEQIGRLTGKVVKGIAKLPFKMVKGIAKLAVSPLTGIYGIAEGITSKRFVDIYLKGKVELGNPLITWKQQLEGEVVFSDGSKINNSYTIDKPIVEAATQKVLITEQDIRNGLCDSSGKPINKNIGLARRIGRGIGKGIRIAGRGIGKAGAFVGNSFKHVFGDIGSGLYNLLAEKGGGGVEGVDTKKKKKIGPEYWKENIHTGTKTLISIEKFLKENMPLREKEMRENSYEDYLGEDAASDAEREERHQKLRDLKDKKGILDRITGEGGLLNGLLEMLGPAGQALQSAGSMLTTAGGAVAGALGLRKGAQIAGKGKKGGILSKAWKAASKGKGGKAKLAAFAAALAGGVYFANKGVKAGAINVNPFSEGFMSGGEAFEKATEEDTTANAVRSGLGTAALGSVAGGYLAKKITSPTAPRIAVKIYKMIMSLVNRLPKFMQGPFKTVGKFILTKILPKIGKSFLLKVIARFAGPVGWVLMAGSAVVAGVQGYRHADEIMQVPEGTLSTGQKILVGIAALISDFLLSLIDVKWLASTVFGVTPRTGKEGTIKDASGEEGTDLDNDGEVDDKNPNAIKDMAKGVARTVGKASKFIASKAYDIFTALYNKLPGSIQKTIPKQILDKTIKSIEKHVSTKRIDQFFGTYLAPWAIYALPSLLLTINDAWKAGFNNAHGLLGIPANNLTEKNRSEVAWCYVIHSLFPKSIASPKVIYNDVFGKTPGEMKQEKEQRDKKVAEGGTLTKEEEEAEKAYQEQATPQLSEKETNQNNKIKAELIEVLKFCYKGLPPNSKSNINEGLIGKTANFLLSAFRREELNSILFGMIWGNNRSSLIAQFKQGFEKGLKSASPMLGIAQSQLTPAHISTLAWFAGVHAMFPVKGKSIGGLYYALSGLNPPPKTEDKEQENKEAELKEQDKAIAEEQKAVEKDKEIETKKEEGKKKLEEIKKERERGLLDRLFNESEDKIAKRAQKVQETLKTSKQVLAFRKLQEMIADGDLDDEFIGDQKKYDVYRNDIKNFDFDVIFHNIGDPKEFYYEVDFGSDHPERTEEERDRLRKERKEQHERMKERQEQEKLSREQQAIHTPAPSSPIPNISVNGSTGSAGRGSSGSGFISTALGAAGASATPGAILNVQGSGRSASDQWAAVQGLSGGIASSGGYGGGGSPSNAPVVNPGRVSIGGSQKEKFLYCLPFLKEACAKTGVDIRHFVAMGSVESGWDPNAVNPNGGASGLFQFMPGTYKEMYRKYGRQYNLVDDVFDPLTNSTFAAIYYQNNIASADKDGVGTSLHPTVRGYMMHAAGTCGGKALMKFYDTEPNSPVTKVLGSCGGAFKESFFRENWRFYYRSKSDMEARRNPYTFAQCVESFTNQLKSKSAPYFALMNESSPLDNTNASAEGMGMSGPMAGAPASSGGMTSVPGSSAGASVSPGFAASNVSGFAGEQSGGSVPSSPSASDQWAAVQSLGGGIASSGGYGAPSSSGGGSSSGSPVRSQATPQNSNFGAPAAPTSQAVEVSADNQENIRRLQEAGITTTGLCFGGGSWNSMGKTNPEALARMTGAVLEFQQATGKKINFTSAFRTLAEQQCLKWGGDYCKQLPISVQQCGAKQQSGAADPGRSKHESGYAYDISGPGGGGVKGMGRGTIADDFEPYANKYGMYRLKNLYEEEQHFQLAGTSGKLRGPKKPPPMPGLPGAVGTPAPDTGTENEPSSDAMSGKENNTQTPNTNAGYTAEASSSNFNMSGNTFGYAGGGSIDIPSPSSYGGSTPSVMQDSVAAANVSSNGTPSIAPSGGPSGSNTGISDSSSGTGNSGPIPGEEQLTGVHPHLIRVIRRAHQIGTQPFKIIEGIRSPARQADLKRDGKSRTLNSAHIVQPDGYGYAVDMYPLRGKKTLMNWEPEFFKLAEIMAQASAELGIPVKWGGLENFALLSTAKFPMTRATGWDGPHYQLPIGKVIPVQEQSEIQPVIQADEPVMVDSPISQAEATASGMTPTNAGNESGTAPSVAIPTSEALANADARAKAQGFSSAYEENTWNTWTPNQQREFLIGGADKAYARSSLMFKDTEGKYDSLTTDKREQDSTLKSLFTESPISKSTDEEAKARGFVSTDAEEQWKAMTPNQQREFTRGLAPEQRVKRLSQIFLLTPEEEKKYLASDLTSNDINTLSTRAYTKSNTANVPSVSPVAAPSPSPITAAAGNFTDMAGSLSGGSTSGGSIDMSGVSTGTAESGTLQAGEGNETVGPAANLTDDKQGYLDAFNKIQAGSNNLSGYPGPMKLALGKLNKLWMESHGGNTLVMTTNSGGGIRSYSQQKKLKEKKGKWAAAPTEYAPHIRGYGIDLGSAQMTEADRSGLLAQAGLYRPLANNAETPEAWHVEPFGLRKGATNPSGTHAGEPDHTKIDAFLGGSGTLPDISDSGSSPTTSNMIETPEGGAVSMNSPEGQQSIASAFGGDMPSIPGMGQMGDLGAAFQGINQLFPGSKVGGVLGKLGGALGSIGNLGSSLSGGLSGITSGLSGAMGSMGGVVSGAMPSSAGPSLSGGGGGSAPDSSIYEGTTGATSSNAAVMGSAAESMAGATDAMSASSSQVSQAAEATANVTGDKLTEISTKLNEISQLLVQVLKPGMFDTIAQDVSTIANADPNAPPEGAPTSDAAQATFNNVTMPSSGKTGPASSDRNRSLNMSRAV
jgi:peptidoglycan L-alanyl-D-glutamate endopeptidase CwlK